MPSHYQEEHAMVSWANRSCDEFEPFEPAVGGVLGSSSTFALTEEKKGEGVTEFFAMAKFARPKASNEEAAAVGEEDEEERAEQREYISYVARMVSAQCGANIDSFQLPESSSANGCPVYRTPHAKKMISGLHPTFILKGTEAQVKRGIELIQNQFSLSASKIKFRLPESFAYDDDADESLLFDRIDPGRKYDLAVNGEYLDAMVTVHQADALRLACSMEIHKLWARTTKIVSVPSKAIGLIKGMKGKRLLKTCLSYGVIIELPSPIFASPETSKEILLAGNQAEGLTQVEAELRQLIERCPMASECMAISPEILDWLLYNPRQRITLMSSLMRHGTSLGVSSASFEVFGETPGSIQMTLKGIYNQLYEYQSVTVDLIVQSASFIGQLERCLAFLCASFGAQTKLSQNCHGRLSLKVSGSKSAVEATFEGLQQTLPQIQGLCSQVTWSFATASEVREFVSGKKDGKIVKIMRETDVMIGLEAIGQEHLRISLMGPSISQVMGALKMVRGELPAETIFYIPEAHHKRLIGHGGKVIQQVMKKHAVYIKFLNAQEAKERVLGTGLTSSSESNSINGRLDNVIVRTPAKNGAVLEEVKAEVLAMADLTHFNEEGLCNAGCQQSLSNTGGVATETKSIRISKQGLLSLSDASRKSLSVCLFTAFGGSVEVGLGQRHTWFDDDSLVLQMTGSRQALDKLYVVLHGGNLLSLTEESLLFNITSSYTGGESPSVCPASPTTSTASSNSPSHPVLDLQDLFALFGTALYTVSSPALSLRSAAAKHAPVSPQMSESEWSQLSWSPKSSSTFTGTNATANHSIQRANEDKSSSSATATNEEINALSEAARIFDSFYNLPTADDPIVNSVSSASPSFSLSKENPHGPIGRKRGAFGSAQAFDPFKVKDWRAASSTWSRHQAW